MDSHDEEREEELVSRLHNQINIGRRSGGLKLDVIRVAAGIGFDDDVKKAHAVLETYGQETSSNKCDTVWNAEEMAFMCKQCGVSDNSCVCVDCFDFDLHEGHDYSLILTAWGSCDCGDTNNWAASACCAKHRAAMDGEPQVSRQAIANARVASLSAVRVMRDAMGRMYDGGPAGGFNRTLEFECSIVLEAVEALLALAKSCADFSMVVGEVGGAQVPGERRGLTTCWVGDDRVSQLG